MPDANDTTPNKSEDLGNSLLGGLRPDELFARGMQSVKMTGSGGLAEWTPPTVEEAARLFPNYEIIEIIGRGGMGAVYKARQLALDRVIAIKLLPLEVSVDRDFAERFKREARTMAKMNHPNIVSVFDFGTTPEGHLFFIMEFVEGTTLHHLIKTTGLKPPQALEIIAGVCEALQYAHSEGVVHRDIKPANVLVDVRGRVKVTDFGLARLNTPSAAEQAGYTMTGTILGTPDYMAPEQKRGMHVDHRADIYSLGVMFYEMLCGQVPQGVFDLPSRLVAVDERVDQVVIRAMQQEPDRRYQNTAEMRHEVQTIRVAKDPNAKAPQPRTGSAPAKGNQTKRIAVGVAAAAAITFAAVVMANRGGTGKDSKAGADSNPGPEPKPLDSAVVAKSTEPAKAPEPKPQAPPAAEPPAVASVPTQPAPVTQPPPVPPEPKPQVPQPSSTGPSTALVPAGSSPVRPTVPVDPRSGSTAETRPVANPEMASAVAQLGPNSSPPNPATSPGGADTGAAPALEEWQRLADQGDALVKKRDPDGAIEAFDAAIEAAENSATPVSRVEIARLGYKMGSLEAGIGETATARGTLEQAKQLLLAERRAGKLDTPATELLGNIEATLRRLPRQ